MLFKHKQPHSPQASGLQHPERFSAGFTLIELLVVISIISLLSTVMLASLNGVREKGRIAAGQKFDGFVYRNFAAYAIGLWEFDDTSDLGLDFSGNEHHGAISGNVGPSFDAPQFAGGTTGLNQGAALALGVMDSTDTPSGRGYSADFDGSSMIDVSGIGSDIDVENITVAFWAKPSVASWALGNGAQFRFYVAPDGMTRFWLRGAGLGITNEISGGTVNIGAWHHVVGTFNGTSQVLYVDGQEVSRDNSPPFGSLDGGTDSFAIGESYISSGAFYNGLLDSVRLYGVALDALAVKELYLTERPHFIAEAR